MADLINRFNAMLAGLPKNAQFSHVRHVDLRKTLSNGGNYKTFWGNEMHPTGKGFALVADEIAKVLKTL